MQRASGDPGKALGAGICVVVDLGSGTLGSSPKSRLLRQSGEDLLGSVLRLDGASQNCSLLIPASTEKPRSKSCRGFWLLRMKTYSWRTPRSPLRRFRISRMAASRSEASSSPSPLASKRSMICCRMSPPPSRRSRSPPRHRLPRGSWSNLLLGVSMSSRVSRLSVSSSLEDAHGFHQARFLPVRCA